MEMTKKQAEKIFTALGKKFRCEFDIGESYVLVDSSFIVAWSLTIAMQNYMPHLKIPVYAATHGNFSRYITISSNTVDSISDARRKLLCYMLDLAKVYDIMANGTIIIPQSTTFEQLAIEADLMA